MYIRSFDEIDGNHQEFIEVFNRQALAYAELGELNIRPKTGINA